MRGERRVEKMQRFNESYSDPRLEPTKGLCVTKNEIVVDSLCEPWWLLMVCNHYNFQFH